MFSPKWQGDTKYFQSGVLAVENGNNTLPCRCLYQKQVAPNLGYNQDLDPDEMTIAVVVDNDAQENPFASGIQQRPPSGKDFARRRMAREVL